MVATNGRTVTVFGGTGFLGRRIVRHLRGREFPARIASRHADRGTASLALMICNFNSWRPTFKTSGQSRMHLPALTAL
jgi:nucleoside-diphosphate-sugar epimerase